MKTKDIDMMALLIPTLIAFAYYFLGKGNLNTKDFMRLIDEIGNQSMRNLLKDEKKQESILKEVNKILKGK